MIVSISLGTLLDRTLAAGPAVHFQPIVELRDGERSLFAMEALSRGPAGTILEDSAAWLAEVRRSGREIDADRASFSAAAVAAARIPESLALSIQVHAATLEGDARFPQFIAEAADARGIEPSRLIVGLTDQRRFRHAGSFLTAVERLRGLGARIAIDDVGAGGARPRLFVELRPDFYKLDPSLVRDCNRGPRARAVLDSFAETAAKFGARIIARGVETASELETIASAGINLLQVPAFRIEKGRP